MNCRFDEMVLHHIMQWWQQFSLSHCSVCLWPEDTIWYGSMVIFNVTYLAKKVDAEDHQGPITKGDSQVIDSGNGEKEKNFAYQSGAPFGTLLCS